MKRLSFFKRIATSAIFIIISNLFLVQAEKIPVRWFIQLSSNESDPVREMFYQWVENYNNSQERIELVIVPSYASCSFDATDTLLALIEEGHPPDIVTNLYSEVWKYLTDLTPYLSKYDLSTVDSAIFYNFSTDGKMRIMPVGINLNLFFYNRDLFDSAGIAYPPHGYGDTCSDGSVWNIDRLRETALKLTFDTKDSNACSPHFDRYNIRQFGFHTGWTNGVSLTKMFGFPRIVGPDSAISVPEHTRTGFTWYYNGIWNDRFIPSGFEFDDMNNDPLASGKVAMSYTYPSYCDNLINASFAWDIAAPPSFDGSIHIPWDLTSFGILNSCKHPEEALEVIFEILNTAQFYGTTLPVFKNMRAEVLSLLAIQYPSIDCQVLSDGLEYIHEVPPDGSAINYNKEAWKLANDMRDYVYYYPDADVNGALDTYFIPRWEAIFTKEDTVPTALFRESGSDANSLSLKAYPVPFHETVAFAFTIHRVCDVRLAVYDLQGKEVEIVINNMTYRPGKYSISWKGRGINSGIYFVLMNAGNTMERIKIIYHQ